MSGDYSRLTDHTRKRFAAVLMQQGRVHLDSDWNELVDELTRRARVQSLDTFGEAAVPMTTPDGFKLTIPPGPPSPLDVAIGAGRCYVGGLLAEAFPGEQVGGAALSYLHQPYLPSPSPVGSAGLFYLDVWLREVTWLEDPDLLEVALGGIDTTTRVQTVWQVKFLGGAGGPPPDCTTDLDAVFPASAGRLSTRAVQPPAPDDPCLLPETGGFRGVENRLYRIEIHAGGAVGAASFKWSRENASVATVVQKIETIGLGSTITVERIGRDPVLRFQKDDWVEVQDDVRELTGAAGAMARVTAVSEVDRTLALDRVLPATLDASKPERHTRVRRWDHRAGVDTATGAIPAASAIGTWFAVEDGIEVQLALDATAAVQEFHVADTWSFAARTADASVEILAQAPPRAIEHHYVPLATLLPGPALSDCRTLWPPAAAGCECVCVTAASHASGSLTLQTAINSVIGAGGGKVCVGPGVFVITAPLAIQGMVSVTLSGTGASSAIAYVGGGGAIEVRDAGEVTIEHLAIINDGRKADPASAAVSAISVAGVVLWLRVERCAMLVRPPNNRDPLRGDGAAVVLRDVIADCAICDNLVFAVAGVASGAGLFAGPDYLVLGRALIERNLIGAASDGVRLDGLTILGGDLVVRGNWITGAGNAGITLLGTQLLSIKRFAAGAVTVAGNHLAAPVGTGIVAGLSDLTIQDNELIGPQASGGTGSQPGIVLVRTAFSPVIGRCIIAQNRVLGAGGDAIAIDTEVTDLTVRGNLVRRAAGGVIMTDDARAGTISVEDNQILDIRGPTGAGAFGIRLSRVLARADASGNTLSGVVAVAGQPAAGILFIHCAGSRADGNVIEAVAAGAQPGGISPFWASLAAMPPFGDVDFVDNLIDQVQALAGDPRAVSHWRAIWVLTAIGEFAPLPGLERLKIANTDLVVFGNGDALAVTGRVERASVRDNTVATGENVLPLIEVHVQTDITCTGNRAAMAVGTSDTWAVRLTARTLIVSNNRSHCGNNSAGDLDLRTLGAATGLPLATVVGNVVHHPIVLNSAPLPAPWQPLNITNA